MIVMLVETGTGRPLAEVLPVSVDASDQSDAGGEATVRLSTSAQPELRSLLVPWQVQVAVAADDGTPLWLGPVVKTRQGLSSSTVEVVARQWEGYLDRVWLPDDYDHDGEVDASTAAALRIAQLRTYLGGMTVRLPVPLPSNTPAPSGVTVTYQWRSGYGAGDWRGAPPSVWADLTQVAEQGVRVWLHPVSDGTVWGLELRVAAPAASSATVLTVGLDVAEATVAVDADPQVDDWFVVGAGGAVAEASGAITGDPQPWLPGSRSFDLVDSQAALQASAQALLAATQTPLLAVDDAEVRGARALFPGEFVWLDVPPGVSGAAPEGRELLLRVASASWRWERGGVERTVLALAQPADSIGPWPIPAGPMARWLSELQSRVNDLEVRRA